MVDDVVTVFRAEDHRYHVAAEKLGLAGADAEAYAKDLVLEEFAEGDHDVFQKVRRDFDAKGVVQSDHQIRRTMDELMAQAILHVKAS